MTDKKQDEPTTTAIAIDGPEREGNDPIALLGSGAPMVKVQANVGCFGLAPGETNTFVQTEELRLNIQQGHLLVVNG